MHIAHARFDGFKLPAIGTLIISAANFKFRNIMATGVVVCFILLWKSAIVTSTDNVNFTCSSRSLRWGFCTWNDPSEHKGTLQQTVFNRDINWTNVTCDKLPVHNNCSFTPKSPRAKHSYRVLFQNPLGKQTISEKTVDFSVYFDAMPFPPMNITLTASTDSLSVLWIPPTGGFKCKDLTFRLRYNSSDVNWIEEHMDGCSFNLTNLEAGNICIQIATKRLYMSDGKWSEWSSVKCTRLLTKVPSAAYLTTNILNMSTDTYATLTASRLNNSTDTNAMYVLAVVLPALTVLIIFVALSLMCYCIRENLVHKHRIEIKIPHIALTGNSQYITANCSFRTQEPEYFDELSETETQQIDIGSVSPGNCHPRSLFIQPNLVLGDSEDHFLSDDSGLVSSSSTRSSNNLDVEDHIPSASSNDDINEIAYHIMTHEGLSPVRKQPQNSDHHESNEQSIHIEELSVRMTTTDDPVESDSIVPPQPSLESEIVCARLKMKSFIPHIPYLYIGQSEDNTGDQYSSSDTKMEDFDSEQSGLNETVANDSSFAGSYAKSDMQFAMHNEECVSPYVKRGTNLDHLFPSRSCFATEQSSKESTGVGCKKDSNIRENSDCEIPKFKTEGCTRTCDSTDNSEIISILRQIQNNNNHHDLKDVSTSIPNVNKNSLQSHNLATFNLIANAAKVNTNFENLTLPTNTSISVPINSGYSKMSGSPVTTFNDINTPAPDHLVSIRKAAQTHRMSSDMNYDTDEPNKVESVNKQPRVESKHATCAGFEFKTFMQQNLNLDRVQTDAAANNRCISSNTDIDSKKDDDFVDTILEEYPYHARTDVQFQTHSKDCVSPYVRAWQQLSLNPSLAEECVLPNTH